MNDEEKIKVAIDRIDRIAGFLVDTIENTPRRRRVGILSVIMCRTQGLCNLASMLKDTSRLLAENGKD